MRIDIGEKVLRENHKIAAELRGMLEERGILSVNMIGSPGCGKTAIFERTLASLGGSGMRVAVLTGDIQTDADAQRLSRYGFPARQITTAGACHLDARMVIRAMDGWDLDELDLLLIENVGNLVCPAEFEVGAHASAMVYSVTEGEEKPLKYPVMFRSVDLVIVNKVDLIPHLDYDLSAFYANLTAVNPGVTVIETSARTGTGIDQWCAWLTGLRSTAAAASGLG